MRRRSSSSEPISTQWSRDGAWTEAARSEPPARSRRVRRRRRRHPFVAPRAAHRAPLAAAARRSPARQARRRSWRRSGRRTPESCRPSASRWARCDRAAPEWPPGPRGGVVPRGLSESDSVRDLDRGVCGIPHGLSSGGPRRAGRPARRGLRCSRAWASRSSEFASSSPSPVTASRAGATATGGTRARLTRMPITAPMTVSSTRSSAYVGVAVPSARTSSALMATWFAVPAVILSAHAISSATTVASSDHPGAAAEQNAEDRRDHDTGEHADAALDRLRERLIQARLHDEQRGDRGEDGWLARYQCAGDEPGGRSRDGGLADLEDRGALRCSEAVGHSHSTSVGGPRDGSPPRSRRAG